jgi:hypothetical protein
VTLRDIITHRDSSHVPLRPRHHKPSPSPSPHPPLNHAVIRFTHQLSTPTPPKQNTPLHTAAHNLGSQLPLLQSAAEEDKIKFVPNAAMTKETLYSWHLSLRVDRPVEVRFIVGVWGHL